MLFSSQSTTVLKKEKKLQIKTEQNETKQKEIKKERGCGTGILQLLECSSLLFVNLFSLILREEQIKVNRLCE